MIHKKKVEALLVAQQTRQEDAERGENSQRGFRSGGEEKEDFLGNPTWEFEKKGTRVPGKING